MNNLGLFSDAVTPSTDGDPQNVQDVTAELAYNSAKIRRSALWAAYGDALGWISELTDQAGLRRRTGGAPLCRPIKWTRRVGGRAGVTISLPQGCYSDDSQLRLATGRAIRSDGFDVEAFAKVELPIWLSYALGAGKSTSTAATNLAKPKVPWFANTFKGWTKSGGNGAAMRIQPHVWAASAPDNVESFLPDVIRNAVCTHSHPTGLMGAVLHALALAHSLDTGHCPSPKDLLMATDVAANLPEIMQKDIEIGSYWRTGFERDSRAFNDAWTQAIDECREAIQVADKSASTAVGADSYAEIIDRLKLRDPDKRGSGILTAVAAVSLIWCEAQPEEALRIAANAIGTDTDTIMTMAGAILGVITEMEPPVEVLDADLFRSEADRLAEIARGGQPRNHQYPDLLHWSAPKVRADALTRSQDGGMYVRGLGSVKAISDPIAPLKNNFMWQWLRLGEGQTLLIKRRRDLAYDDEESKVLPTRQSLQRTTLTGSGANKPSPGSRQAHNVHKSDAPASQISSKGSSEQSEPLNLQLALDYIAKHKDDDKSIGGALRRVVNKGTRGQIAAFTSTLIEHLRQPE